MSLQVNLNDITKRQFEFNFMVLITNISASLVQQKVKYKKNN